MLFRSKGLFGIMTFKVAVVFDAFSRMPLSVRVFSKEASAREIARFVSKAARRHGRPAHFISDHVGVQWELPGALARRNDSKKAVGEVLDFVE